MWQHTRQRCLCVAVSQTVGPNQEIHNYYEEVSTHIKYKLSEFKGLTAAWRQHQDADTAVEQATAALAHAEEEVCINQLCCLVWFLKC